MADELNRGWLECGVVEGMVRMRRGNGSRRGRWIGYIGRMSGVEGEELDL